MRIAGLVLAGGRSSRMAPRNKLLVTVGGEPMVRHVAHHALASGAQSRHRGDRARSRFCRRGAARARRHHRCQP